MNNKIEQLIIPQTTKVKMNQIYDWFVEKINAQDGSYQVPKLSVLAPELNTSDNSLGKYLKQFVKLGLLSVNKIGTKWRYATYSLPEMYDGEPKESWHDAEPVEEEQVAEVSEIELVPYIEGHSQLILNERKILDFDLAPIYGVSTSALNQAYKRNLDMFEDDWVIQLDNKTWSNLSQSVIGSPSREAQKHRDAPPLIYNAEGANSVAFQLKQSPIARKRAKTIIKVFSDLERMTHGEEPKQSGFAEAISSLVEYNKSLTTNIFRLTSGVEAIKVDLDTRKADKKEVDEVKRTAEEAQYQAKEASRKVDDVTTKVENLVNQNVVDNRQAIIDKYRHIATWLNYWESGFDYSKNKKEYGVVSSHVCWQIKREFNLPDKVKTTQIPPNLHERVISYLRKIVFEKLSKSRLYFYNFEDEYRKFLIEEGFNIF